MKLIPLVVYKVTKNSSDNTFEVNDIIWKCKNSDIMCPNKGGWIKVLGNISLVQKGVILRQL